MAAVFQEDPTICKYFNKGVRSPLLGIETYRVQFIHLHIVLSDTVHYLSYEPVEIGVGWAVYTQVHLGQVVDGLQR